MTRSGKRGTFAQKFEIEFVVLHDGPERKENDGTNPASVAHTCDVQEAEVFKLLRTITMGKLVLKLRFDCMRPLYSTPGL